MGLLEEPKLGQRNERPENDSDSSGDDVFGDVGFMFDGALPKTRRFFRFGDISVAVRLVDDDPGAVQSGHYIWPAAPALSAYLVDRRLALPHGCGGDSGGGGGSRCLELGAGCGLAGLVAAQLHGTSAVVFTDHDPGVLEMIRESIAELEQNPGLGESTAAAKCRCVPLSWGPVGEVQRALLADALSSVAAVPTAAPSPLSARPAGRHGAEGAHSGGFGGHGGGGCDSGAVFDLVIASDVVYSVSVVGPLFQTVSDLLASSTGSRTAARSATEQSTEAGTEQREGEGRVGGEDEEVEGGRENEGGHQVAGNRSSSVRSASDVRDTAARESSPPLPEPSQGRVHGCAPFGGGGGDAREGGGFTDDSPVFLMSQSFGYDSEIERAIDKACLELGLLREVVWDELPPPAGFLEEQRQQQQKEEEQPAKRSQHQDHHRTPPTPGAQGGDVVPVEGRRRLPTSSGTSSSSIGISGTSGESFPLSRQGWAGTKLQRFWRL